MYKVELRDPASKAFKKQTIVDREDILMNDPCQSIGEMISQILDEIQYIQDQLNNVPGSYPKLTKQQKEKARELLPQLQEKYERLEGELRQCLDNSDPCRYIKEKIASDNSGISNLTAQINALIQQITPDNAQVIQQQINQLNAQLTQLQKDLLQQEQALQECQQSHP